MEHSARGVLLVTMETRDSSQRFLLIQHINKLQVVVQLRFDSSEVLLLTYLQREACGGVQTFKPPSSFSIKLQQVRVVLPVREVEK